MTERSRKLQRQFKKHFGNVDAEVTLLGLQQKLMESADPNAVACSELLAGFSAFLDAIEESYNQYEDKNKMAMRNLQLSSEELNSANMCLEHLSQSVSAMLNGLGQGLLFFDEGGMCSDVYSKACIRLIGMEPAHKHITDVLGLDEAKSKTFGRLIAVLFSGAGALGFDELAELAPNELVNQEGAYIQVEYRPMYNAGGELKSILVVFTDITTERKALEKLKEREKRALQTLRISRNRNFFYSFVVQMNHLLAEWDRLLLNDRVHLKRELHTLKTVAATFQLLLLSDHMHIMESLIEQNDSKKIKAAKEKLEELFEYNMDIARNILGSNFESKGNTRVVEVNVLAEVAAAIQNIETQGLEQTKLVYRLLAVPVHHLLENFDIELQESAQCFDKIVNPVVFEGENFDIIPECYAELFSSFVHILRNIVDHGIEEPALREQFGKEAEGTVTIHTVVEEKDGESWCTISFADDGCGIDVDALRARLRDSVGAEKVEAMSDEEVMQCIFMDDITTRAEVTQQSGRGVGMAAVKREAEKLGGSVHVTSAFAEGTITTVSVPLLNNVACVLQS